MVGELSALPRQAPATDGGMELVAEIIPRITTTFSEALPLPSDRVSGVGARLRGEQERDARANGHADCDAEGEDRSATMVGRPFWCGGTRASHAGGRGVRRSPKGDESRVVGAFAARGWAGV